MTDKEYVDLDGIRHLSYDHNLCEVWRLLMKQHMDICHEHGLNAGTAANLMINGAAYLLAAYYQHDEASRITTAEKMANIFVAKVEQSVGEIKRDQDHAS